MTVVRVQVFDLELGGGDYPPPVVGDVASYDLRVNRVGDQCHPDLATVLDVAVEPGRGSGPTQGSLSGTDASPLRSVLLRAEGLAAVCNLSRTLPLGRSWLTVELEADGYFGEPGEEGDNTGIIRRVQSCTWTTAHPAGALRSRGQLSLADATSVEGGAAVIGGLGRPRARGTPLG